MATKQNASDKEQQYHEFIQTARALECDESEQRFNEALGKVARQKPAIQHASDCAVHNGPAYEAGPCDCGAVKAGR